MAKTFSRPIQGQNSKAGAHCSRFAFIRCEGGNQSLDPKDYDLEGLFLEEENWEEDFE